MPKPQLVNQPWQHCYSKYSDLHKTCLCESLDLLVVSVILTIAQFMYI